ncbi:MAG: DNA replication/repair protein RecF [Chloroflexi bacterium]|nr:DNA replication/repair protein RecF [Chloroflexota bacterium]
MHITYLSLTNFRNYGRLELNFPTGTTLLYGNNAQGKTNLLEAIYYLATTRSPFAETDQQLIAWEATQMSDEIIVARLIAHITSEKGQQQIEMRLIQEKKPGLTTTGYSFRRQALVNRRKVRLMDLLGTLRVVLFLPEDVQLITGSPSGRRRYLDITLCQIDPIYCQQLSNYNKVLEQRNALLRQIGDGSSSPDVLPIFTDKLVELGSQIFARRATFLKNIGHEAQRIHYEMLTSGQELIRVSYLPRLERQPSRGNGTIEKLFGLEEWLNQIEFETSAIKEKYQQSLLEAESFDLNRGTTSVGPHRDDWRIWINNRDLGYYGSRGQQRSAILALKIAEINWMTTITQEKPILLLDEVVAELDEERRASLLHTIQDSSQAVLTATDPSMFTDGFLHQAHNMKVENGRVILQEHSS